MEQDFITPIQTRNSLPTYRRQQVSHFSHSTTKLSSLSMYVLIIVCSLIAISFLISEERELESEIMLNKSEEYDESNSRGIVYFENIDDFHIHNGEFEISVPIVAIDSNLKNEKSQKEQLEESLENVKVFEFLRKNNKNSHHDLEKYFFEVSPLTSVQHHKFTSPSEASDVSITDIEWWNPFRNQLAEEYLEVNRVFDKFNTKPWKSQGKHFTAMSNQPIKPTLLHIELPEYLLGSRTLNIYGISVFGAALASNKGLELTLIKRVEVYPGENRIECDRPECTIEYSMIMLLMDGIHLTTLRIYTKKHGISPHYYEHSY